MSGAIVLSNGRAIFQEEIVRRPSGTTATAFLSGLRKLLQRERKRGSEGTQASLAAPKRFRLDIVVVRADTDLRKFGQQGAGPRKRLRPSAFVVAFFA